MRGIVVALVMGVGAGLVMGRFTFLTRFIQTHTPRVDVSSPQTLTGLPILTELPSKPFLALGAGFRQYG